MSLIGPDRTAERASVSGPPTTWDYFADRAFRALARVGVCLILLLLAFILWTIGGKALVAMRDHGLSFLTSTTWDVGRQQFGVLPQIWGTLYSSLLALAIGGFFGVVRGAAMLARGNEGVAARIRGSEDSIGYVEYHFAKRLGLAMAQLQNKAGRYVEPGERTGQIALTGSASRMPANLRVFLPDPEGEDAYPIVTYTWLLLYDRYGDRDKAAALRKFVRWGLTEGQAHSRALDYIPLPPEIATLSLAAVERLD